ncbi:MAG TPA: HEPN domain-containing protein [Pirellulaceae bacterium]|jgi:HEPN domain-containing protein|nr:HEPN domain-containing protein [Pirellulaceae bacterium]
MNVYQEHWWNQAKSDYEAFAFLRREGARQCHCLHYLQMATEKIAKAYFWRSGSPPPRNHSGFVQCLRFLGQVRRLDQERLCRLLKFSRFTDFENWIRTALPLAYDLEHLSPNLANDGPNPEYPWPHHEPANAPATHDFAIWRELEHGRGRDLMRVIGTLVERFPEYADT